MTRKRYKCPQCGEATTYYREGTLCAYCGQAPMVLLNKNAIPFNSNPAYQTRVYQRLTAKEKDAIKTFIVNNLSEFRSRNIALIQQNWQLLAPAFLFELWNSVAMSVINPSPDQHSSARKAGKGD